MTTPVIEPEITLQLTKKELRFLMATSILGADVILTATGEGSPKKEKMEMFTIALKEMKALEGGVLTLRDKVVSAFRQVQEMNK